MFLNVTKLSKLSKKIYVRYFQKRRDTQFVNYYEEKIQFMQ